MSDPSTFIAEEDAAPATFIADEGEVPKTFVPDSAPDLSQVKLSPYQTLDRNGLKPPSGMESGTELLTAVGSSPVGRAAIAGGEALGGQIEDTAKWIGDAYLRSVQGDSMGAIETLTQPVARAAGYQLGEAGKALWRPVGELAGESDWDELSKQYPKLMAIPKVVKGVVESVPKMAAQTLLGPEIGPAVWGLTDEGFDAKTAATMYALPWVKNYTGAIAENVASKMGINNELAKQVVNRVAGGTAMAGVLTGEQIDELRKLSPEERAKRAPETIGNALAMFAMGTLERGRMPEKPAKAPPVTGELLSIPKGSTVPPKVPFELPDAAERPPAPEPPVVPPEAQVAAQPIKVGDRLPKTERDAEGFADVDNQPEVQAAIDSLPAGTRLVDFQVGSVYEKQGDGSWKHRPDVQEPGNSSEQQRDGSAILFDRARILRLGTGDQVVVPPVAVEPAVAPAEKPATPMPPTGDRLVTVERPDGSRYLASFGDKFWPGEVPSIAKLNSQGKWSHGMAGKDEKIIDDGGKGALEPPKPSTPSAPDVPPVAPVELEPPASSVGLSAPVDTSVPIKSKRAYSGAKYQADATEFERLVQEYGMNHEHGWIKNPDFVAPKEGTWKDISSNTELTAAYLRVLEQLGLKTDRATLRAKAKALPKLKALLEKHAKMVPVPLTQMQEGSEFTRLGENHKVAGTNQKTGMVTIKDGIPIKVHMDDSVNIDPGSLKTPLKLDQPESVAQQNARLEAEKAAALKKSQGEAAQAGAAKKLEGGTGDLGQRDLLSVPDLFNKPAAPEKGMGGPGSPSRTQGPDTGAGGWQDQSGRDIYGIAQRVREQRAKAGQVVPVESGVGVSGKETVEWGRELLRSGVDPEKALQEFEKPGHKFSYDMVAVTRAHGEALAKAASDIESRFGTDSTAYRTAKKALDDWDTRTKPIATEAHKAFTSFQGATDIDTGTFTGISRAYREATGQDLNPSQVKTAKKVAKDVSEADKAAQTAKPNLQTVIDNIPEPGVIRVSPYIIKIAESIVSKLDARADASRKALREMSMRFSSGVDPTVILHLTNIGASHIGHFGLDFVKWSDAMIKDVGPKLEERLKEFGSSLKDIFDRSQKLVDSEGDKHGPNADTIKQTIKKTVPKSKVPTDIADQKKAFSDFQSGKPMSPDQLKTLWTRAMEYIKPDGNDMADVVYKVAADLGVPAKDVLKGLNQSRSVKRVADDVWQKQRQARILKQSAKRWIETAQETWMQKVLPVSARALFSAKVGLHGTVALGTHAPLVAATHPIIFINNFGKMHKLVACPEYYQMQGKALARRPNYNTAQRAGLVNDMAKMEDFNDPRLALRFPKGSEWFRKKLDKVHLGRLVGMGTRGYSVLKILRQDLFDHEWDKLAESQRTPDMAKAIADSMNHITGVDATKLPSVANYALFAPKLLLSRVKVIAGDPLRAVNSLSKMRDMTDAEKWFAKNQFKEKARIFGTATGLLIANQQLNNLFGDDKKLNGVPKFLGGGGMNSMDSDFMKFRVAGMNVAWGSPFLTMSRMPLRLIQIGMGNGGKTRFLIYPDESMYKTAGSYLRTQESPFMSPIMSLLTKADWQDRPLPQIPGYGPPPPIPKRLAAQGIKPYSWLEFGSEIFMPIPIEEGVKEIWHYGLGATPEQQTAMGKSFAITILMAATGGRIQEDWNKSSTPSTAPPPWESFR